jgi:cytochrome c553
MNRRIISVLIGLPACLSAIALMTESKAGVKKGVTFSEDVAPIFHRHCAACHRPGGMGPMSLVNFKDARPWAKSIRESVINRQMPPWPADARYGHWSNDRRLSDADLNTIVAWVDGGVKEGNPKQAPPAPQFNDEWTMGKPDAVITMDRDHTIKANGPDDYVWYTVPANFTEDRFIQAVEIRPGNAAIVHHAAILVQRPNGSKDLVEARKQRQQVGSGEAQNIFVQEGGLNRVSPSAPVFDDGCANAKADGALGRDNDNTDITNVLSGLAPGKGPDVFPEGMALRIPAGSDIIFQMHYSNPTGKTQTDRTSVGLRFAKQKPERLLYPRPISNYLFKLPPRVENHRVTACYTAREDIHVLRFLPHMHLRGKSMEVKAFYPDGRSEILLSIPNYQFNWQTAYEARQPISIRKGTRLMVTAHYDNSAKNKYNPNPDATARWGDATGDEMMSCFIYYYVDGEKLKTTASVSQD